MKSSARRPEKSPKANAIGGSRIEASARTVGAVGVNKQMDARPARLVPDHGQRADDSGRANPGDVRSSESVGDTASDLLPVLTSDLVDDEALDFLWGVALAGGTARVPLIAPPIDATDHALEVYAPGSPQPLLLIALPLGPPNDEGYPLRLRPAPSSVARATRNRPSSADLRPGRC